MQNSITILSLVKKPEIEASQESFHKLINKYGLSGGEESALKIGPMKQIPNQFIFALEVPKDIAISVVKDLVYEGIQVVKNETFIKIAVNEAVFELQNEQTNKIQQLQKEETIKQKLKKKADYTIEELVNIRDWQLMLEIALRQSHDNIEKSRKIKELLPDVLEAAISSELEKDTNSLETARSSVERLLLIAENETLKRFHLHSIMRKAGEAVIQICGLHPDELISELIFLANSRNTVPYINVKSFLCFFRAVSKDVKKYENEIMEAIRFLNTRALDTVYLSSVKLTAEEKKLFSLGIEFFKSKRAAL